MNVRQTILLPVLGLIFLINSATAGVLDDNLAEKVKSLRSDEMVKVWIKLPRLEEPSKARASANAATATRAGRYQYAAERFCQGHRIAQAELLSALGGLERQNVASHVKGHWVANIVEAEVAVSQLEQLAARLDVEKIYAVPKIATIPAVPGRAVEPMADTVSENINFINAPAAWAAGYTGAGRIVCSFDTGVDGDHPALLANWKGHDGDSAAAWFDPKGNEPFPHTFPLSDGVPEFNPSHGTHTMGTMVGHDISHGYRMGVAPGARWISAGILDLEGTSLIDAFEWAADPDGDPNSVDDLPDVINHSWGVQDIPCQNVFYDLIDNLETLGIVQIFAAGNSGNLGDSTIYNPADGDRDELDCFSVGAVDSVHLSPPLVLLRPAFGSSLGPSLCRGGHKPNVVAPGFEIISSYPGGGYSVSTGTSMAAPHVAGLVALLRQKNPNATVDEIKTAILVSARDYTYSLPNDTLGWGVIDCKAALDSLSDVNAVPNVRVYAYDHAPISAGNTVRGTMVLQNLGASVSDVSATITGSNPNLTVLSGSAYFGAMAEGDTVRSGDSIKVIVADGILYGTILSLDFQISGTGYSNNAKLHFLVEPHTQRSLVTHNSGRIEFSLTNFGTYGLGEGSFYSAGGAGFVFDGGDNDLYEGGLMIGVSGNQVSDGVRNAIGEWDGDFRVAPDGNLFMMTPSPRAPEESFSRMNDERAENPIGIELQQSSYSFADPSNDDFIIIRYVMRNTNDYLLNGVYAGIYMDWDIMPSYLYNVGGYDAAGEFLWMAYYFSLVKSNWRGMKVLHGNTVAAVTQESGILSYPEGYTEAEKFGSLMAGFATADQYKALAGDYNQVLAVGPINLAPDGVDTIAFALIAGVDSAAISAAAATAQTTYDNVVVSVREISDGRELPSEFNLSQNYPNPFNPSTIIKFDLPTRSKIEVAVFNVLGQVVKTLVDEVKPAGRYAVTWDGTDSRGRQAAAGVYLYRVKTDDYTASKKMILLK